LLQRCFR